MVGRLMTQIAHWRLEKGIKLGTLEQFLGSKTVGGSVISIIRLRVVNLLCVAIIAGWAFSPLGSQGILRMLNTKLAPVTEPSTITYYDTDSKTRLSDWSTVSQVHSMAVENGVLVLDSMYRAVLLTSDSAKADTMDHWGNVKIPYLDSYSRSRNSNDWKTVPDNNESEFSSLVGIPVSGIAPGNTTFSLESTYVHLDCGNITKTSVTVDDEFVATFPRLTEMNSSALCFAGGSPNGCGVRVPNGTWQGHALDDWLDQSSGRSSWKLAMDRFIDPLWSERTTKPDRTYPGVFANETGVRMDKSTLLFQASLTTDIVREAPSIFKSRCDVTQRYVESRVHCERTSPSHAQTCAVVAQRRSRRPHAPEAISQLSFPAIFRYVSGKLPLATSRTSFMPGMSLEYINDPSVGAFARPGLPALERVPPRDLSMRLGRLINSYLMLSQPDNATVTLTGSVARAVEMSANATVVADAETLVEEYVIDRAWAALYMASCAVLLAAAAWSAVLTHKVHVPEVLGYASTVIRDSKFMDLEPETGRLNGLDLTLQLRNQEVRYGVTQVTLRGAHLAGVGPTSEVEPVKP